MDHTIKNLGMKIRERRINKGLTQDVLSLRAGLTKSYVSLLEAGKKVPAISTLARIATALGINLGDFFEILLPLCYIRLIQKQVLFIYSDPSKAISYQTNTRHREVRR